MKLLLDTNAYSALMRGHRQVVEQVKQASQIFLSTIVIGELLAGFRNGNQEATNRRALSSFLSNPLCSTIPVSHETAERFSILWLDLRKKGRPIPTNDLWIAAHAMETGARLLSFDQHFEAIDGLYWNRPTKS